MPFKNPFSKQPGASETDLLKHLRTDSTDALDANRGAGSSLLPDGPDSVLDAAPSLSDGLLGGDHDLRPDPDEFLGGSDDGQSI